jgi:hypothetical protein
VIRDDGVDYIRRMKEPVQYIYVDPSRRKGGRRIFSMQESEPDPVAIHQELLKKAGKVLIKLSPYIDINYLAGEFRQINQIHVVAIGGECREILVVLDSREFTKEPYIVTWAYETNGIQEFISTQRENLEPCRYGMPRRYILDPNVAIRKSGLFNALGRRFNLEKLAPNSHLYTHDRMIGNFPGRVFELERIMKFKDLQQKKTLKQANIATRNFRLKPEEIRKRTRINEGGDTFVFCTTDHKNKQIVLITRRVETETSRQEARE